jgi:hypothetical protein
MVSDLLREYKADKAISNEFENPEVGRFEKSLDGIFMRWKMDKIS